jgi:hypothetical protein
MKVSVHHTLNVVTDHQISYMSTPPFFMHKRRNSVKLKPIIVHVLIFLSAVM